MADDPNPFANITDLEGKTFDTAQLAQAVGNDFFSGTPTGKWLSLRSGRVYQHKGDLVPSTL